MTPELIELEFEHIQLDIKAKNGGEVFEDEDFENYDKETDANDKLLSDMPTPSNEDSEDEELPKSVETDNPDEWEDVEIDDLDDDED